ncbi:uncharacterized protein UHOD_02557 [Ustilago sp. UG-2017b]|nr:uncharacterized protein UHOD_02557 [Ustilago sp. UG-2017b]
MLASSSTFASTTLHSSFTSSSCPHAPLLLRGTCEGELAATLSSHPYLPHSSSTAASSSPGLSSKAERNPLFTWPDVLCIVSTGILQHLARHPDDLREYFAWMDDIRNTYGSTDSFLLAERFTARYLLSRPSQQQAKAKRNHFEPWLECQILLNGWPYSVPKGVTHWVVWSYLPILLPDLVEAEESAVKEKIWRIVAKRGLCGTLDTTKGLKVPTVEDHKRNMPDLSLKGKEEEEEVGKVLRGACGELVKFIERRCVTPGYSLVRILAARECPIGIFSREYTSHKKVRYLSGKSLLVRKPVLKLASI